jgi:GNAT superfamily N-acetyltransferase
MKWKNKEFRIDTDQAKLDIPFIHSFLTHSYWAEGIRYEAVEKSIRNSIGFGVFHLNCQVGFAQVITDKTLFGYLLNVSIIENYRGRGLSRWLMDCILDHPDIKDLNVIMLATRDAQGLYAKFDFKALPDPARIMRREKK